MHLYVSMYAHTKEVSCQKKINGLHFVALLQSYGEKTDLFVQPSFKTMFPDVCRLLFCIDVHTRGILN